MPREHSGGLDMALLLLLSAALLQEPVCSSLFGSRFLAGALGGSITHQCFYSPTPANRHQRKFWCKVAADGLCYTIISSRSPPWGQYRGRVALGDAPQNGTLTVTMAGLRGSDSGTYRCGIGSSNHGLFASLNLTVLPDATVPRPTQLVRGELHGSVTVLCPPGDPQSAQKRFWCKVGRSSCSLLASSDGYVGRRHQGRIVLTPPDSSGAFKVLMNDLKEEDSGLYLCGTGTGLRGQHSAQEVVLQVATASALPRRPKFLSGTVGGSLSFQCHHDPEGSYQRQYLCRWRAGSCAVLLDLAGFVLEPYRGRLRVSGTHPGGFSVLLRPLREEDAGWYWCGASSGRSELTAPLQLLIHKGTCSSRDPGTSTPVRATAPSPAAQGTAGHGMDTVTRDTMIGTVTRDTSMGTVTQNTTIGTVPKDTTIGTVPKDTTMATVPKDTTIRTVTRDTSMGTVTRDTMIGTVPKDTTMASVTQDISMGTVPKDTMIGTVPKDTMMASVIQDTSMGTVTHGSSSLLLTATSATPGPPPSSAGEAFQESSSAEPQLLPVLLPALILLICFTITILALAKIKLQKQTGGERSAARSPGAARGRAGLGGERRTEETPSAGEERGLGTGPARCRTISGILGNIRMSSFYLPYGEKLLIKVPDGDLSQNLL